MLGTQNDSILKTYITNKHHSRHDNIKSSQGSCGSHITVTVRWQCNIAQFTKHKRFFGGQHSLHKPCTSPQHRGNTQLLMPVPNYYVSLFVTVLIWQTINTYCTTGFKSVILSPPWGHGFIGSEWSVGGHCTSFVLPECIAFRYDI